MQKRSEYREDNRTAVVWRDTNGFVVKYFKDNQCVGSNTYAHEQLADDAAEDFALGEPVTLEDSTVIDSGLIRVHPVDK